MSTQTKNERPGYDFGVVTEAFKEFHIHGCKDVRDKGKTFVEEVTDEQADYFGVYVRLSVGGLLKWIADLPSRAIASEYVTSIESLIKMFNGIPAMPNGFGSWSETHFEVVSELTEKLRQDRGDYQKRIAEAYHVNPDTNGMYLLAEKLTNEFEEKNKDREWDGEFFDEIEAFTNEKLK